jgi:hypothetical protein
MAIAKTYKQHAGAIVTQSLDVGITIIGVETIITPTMDVVRRGVLIGSVKKLGSGSGGVFAGRKLNGNMTLPTTTTRVVGHLRWCLPIQ